MSGGIWPCETPATAVKRCAKSNSLLKLDDKKSGKALLNSGRAILFEKIKKGGNFMKTVRELFLELDEWKAYEANSTMSNIAKINHISRVKREIANRIDVEEYRDYILFKEKG